MEQENVTEQGNVEAGTEEVAPAKLTREILEWALGVAVQAEGVIRQQVGQGRYENVGALERDILRFMTHQGRNPEGERLLTIISNLHSNIVTLCFFVISLMDGMVHQTKLRQVEKEGFEDV